MFRFKGPFLGDAQILGLIDGEFREFGSKTAQMEARHLFVQMFRQDIDLLSVGRMILP